MRWRDRGHTTFGQRMRLTERAEVFDPYFPFVRVSQRLPLGRRESKEKIGLCCFRALDVCAEFAQFFIEMFVATVDVINAADFGNSVGF